MKQFTRLATLFLIFLSSLTGCKKNSDRGLESTRSTAVIAIGTDFDYLNPLIIQLGISREVCNLLYPTLFYRNYDEANGSLTFEPAFASSWKFSDGGKQVTLVLRNDVYWSDGKKVTAHDLAFSYRLYGNPDVASTRQQYIGDFLRNSTGDIDFEKSIQIQSDTVITLSFSKQLTEAIFFDHFYDLLPIPKHIYETVAPRDFRAKSSELPILSAGPFKVMQWDRQSKLVLVPNESSVLPHPAKLSRVEFQVIPEYTTRLTALKSGSADVLMASGGIAPPDAERLGKEAPNLQIIPVRNRFFDSIVWLTIDGEAYRNGKKILPNFFFGEKRVRQAMTYAINREAIVDGFMRAEHATIVNSSLSPAYKYFHDTTLHGYEYNPQKAKALLAESGWKPGSNGILEKNGKAFSFKLVAPTGNARRSYAATIIQQNLKEIGIDCKLEYVETVLWNKGQNSWQYDATIAGLGAETLPFQLVMWGSDFERNNFNSSAFQNSELDEILAKLSIPQSPESEKALWHRFQAILHDEQPRTFLYYFDELEGVSKKLKGVKMNMLMTLFNLHEWEFTN